MSNLLNVVSGAMAQGVNDVTDKLHEVNEGHINNIVEVDNKKAFQEKYRTIKAKL